MKFGAAFVGALLVGLLLSACGEARNAATADQWRPLLAIVTGGTSPGDGTPGGASAKTETTPATTTPVTTTKSPGGEPALSQDRAIGQMLISHVSGLSASPHLLARIRAGQVGSVILFGENIVSNEQLKALTSSLQQAARAGGNPPLFIGLDQEGGPVKRIPSAPPTESAAQMGSSANPRSTAERQGLETGEYLRRWGVNLDFAPVSDIPNTADNFLGERAFGHVAHQVVEGATGFAIGLSLAHVAGSAKHFPGLGDAGARDTDLEVVTIGASKRELREGYAPYERMAASGASVAPMVMISNAIYPNLDPSDLPADLSRVIVGNELAAAHMGNRVTITDDLEVPAVERYPDGPIKAALAGDDMLMFAQDEQSSERAFRQLRAAVASGLIPRTRVIAAAGRVDALKRTLDLG